MNKKTERSIFQVLLLDNADSRDVEVQEGEDVDYNQVKQHLKNGGSVFITSNNSQKITLPKSRSQQNYSRSRKSLGFLLRQQLRGS